LWEKGPHDYTLGTGTSAVCTKSLKKKTLRGGDKPYGGEGLRPSRDRTGRGGGKKLARTNPQTQGNHIPTKQKCVLALCRKKNDGEGGKKISKKHCNQLKKRKGGGRHPICNFKREGGGGAWDEPGEGVRAYEKVHMEGGAPGKPRLVVPSGGKPGGGGFNRAHRRPNHKDTLGRGKRIPLPCGRVRPCVSDPWGKLLTRKAMAPWSLFQESKENVVFGVLGAGLEHTEFREKSLHRGRRANQPSRQPNALKLPGGGGGHLYIAGKKKIPNKVGGVATGGRFRKGQSNGKNQNKLTWWGPGVPLGGDRRKGGGFGGEHVSQRSKKRGMGGQDPREFITSLKRGLKFTNLEIN